MKECDIFGESKHTLTPTTYFQEVKIHNPGICAHVYVTVFPRESKE